MLESANKSREKSTIAQSDLETDLTAKQKLSPKNWKLLIEILALLKPPFIPISEISKKYPCPSVKKKFSEYFILACVYPLFSDPLGTTYPTFV